MSNDIREYFSLGTRLSERKLTQRLMDEVRHLMRTGKWNTYETLEEWQAESHYGQEYIVVKSFFLHYKGLEMLAVVLFPHNNMKRYSNYGYYQFDCFVFTDDYVFTSRPLSGSRLWEMNLQWNEELLENLSRYDAMHPRARLTAYLEHSKQQLMSGGYFGPIQRNFLLPLFAQYHKGLELLVKANLLHLTRTMFACDRPGDSVLRKDSGTYNNLKEWLGVSHNVLKKLDQMLKDDVGKHEGSRGTFAKKGWWHITGQSRNTNKPLQNQEFFARLADIADYNPEYLNLPVYTPRVLQFYMENHLIHHKPKHGDYPIRRTIPGLAKMTDQQVLRVIRRIAELPDLDAHAYMDYLCYCGKCKGLAVRDYPHGLTPNNTLLAAEKALDILAMYEEMHMAKQFRNKTKAQSYQFLKLDKSEAGISDRFCISTPREAADLVRESDILGHCVREYCKDVANGKTYILFLRRADKPDKPYVTMEVSKSYKVVQVKARENKPATLEAQQFILEWAKYKGLKIDTDDMDIAA